MGNVDWNKFSEKCLELLSDNLVGISLYGSVVTGDAIPGYGSDDVIIILKQKNKEIIKNTKKIGNFFRDETGKTRLFLYTIDELGEIEPLRRLSLIKHTKTIYGESISFLLKVPSKKELAKSLKREIQSSFKPICTSVLISSDFCNESRKRHDPYFILKKAVWAMSICYFINSGEYLASRTQLSSKIDNDLSLICNILNKYNVATEQEIEKALESALSLFTRIENELKHLIELWQI